MRKVGTLLLREDTCVRRRDCAKQDQRLAMEIVSRDTTTARTMMLVSLHIPGTAKMGALLVSITAWRPTSAIQSKSLALENVSK